MVSQKQAMSVIDGLDIAGLEKEVKHWKTENIRNIGLTLRGSKEELLKIENLLCEASHSILSQEDIEKAGVVKGFYRYQERILNFLNDRLELVSTDYLGFGGNTEYKLDLNRKNRLFIELKYYSLPD